MTIDAPTGWLETDDGVSYPPEPWFLGGDLVVSVFLVPERDLPASYAQAIPRGVRPLRIGGRVPVGVGVAHYLSGGVLQYEEVLAAVPVVGEGGIRVMITAIWVTSVPSQRGARALWSIPKQIANIDRRVTGPRSLRVAASVDGSQLVEVAANVDGAWWPWPCAFPLATAQRLDGRERFTRNTVRAQARRADAAWRFDPAGDLGFLADRSPAFTFALVRAAIVFGQATSATP